MGFKLPDKKILDQDLKYLPPVMQTTEKWYKFLIRICRQGQLDYLALEHYLENRKNREGIFPVTVIFYKNIRSKV